MLRFISTAICLLASAAALDAAQQGSAAPPCATPVTPLYPAEGSVLSIGNGHTFLANYFVVQSCTPRVCRYSDRNVSYDQMKPVTNPGDGLYQTNLFVTENAKAYTYYVSCRGADGSTTPPIKLSFSMAAEPSSIVPTLRAVAHSPTSVFLQWAPTSEKDKEYQIFRDGVKVGTSPTSLYVDQGLQPSHLYRYSVAAVFATGVQPACQPAPVMTLRAEPAPASPAPPLLLDDFESPLRVVNPHLERPSHHNLWSVYPGGDLSRHTASIGLASVTNEDAYSGKGSLQAVLTGETPPPTKTPGGMYLFFYPYTEKDNHWHFMREYISSGKWKLNTYNRMRFWVKVPKSFESMYLKGGMANTQIGTYVRSSQGNFTGSGGQESGVGGSHFYHTYNIPYSGQWHQIILDTHPKHSRGGWPYFEWGDSPYPTGEQGYNYFDLLTTFYVDMASAKALPSYPSTFYFDGFELYQDTNPENTDQISSLNGVYMPQDKSIFVGWNHPKDDGKTKYEVRYSFEDIFKTGWEQAKPAPGGTVSPAAAVYNSMEYVSNKLPLAGHDKVMIGIKPANSPRFRQIVIPLDRK